MDSDGLKIGRKAPYITEMYCLHFECVGHGMGFFDCKEWKVSLRQWTCLLGVLAKGASCYKLHSPRG